MSEINIQVGDEVYFNFTDPKYVDKGTVEYISGRDYVIKSSNGRLVILNKSNLDAQGKSKKLYKNKMEIMRLEATIKNCQLKIEALQE